MTRYAHKVDDNHWQILSALTGIGVGVIDTSGYPGFVDLITVKAGVVRLLEIKDGDKSPSRRKLTISQVRLHETFRVHGATIHVVTSVDEALTLHGAKL